MHFVSLVTADAVITMSNWVDELVLVTAHAVREWVKAWLYVTKYPMSNWVLYAAIDITNMPHKRVPEESRNFFVVISICGPLGHL